MFESGLGPVELVITLAIAAIALGPKSFSELAVGPLAEMALKVDVLNTRCP